MQVSPGAVKTELIDTHCHLDLKEHFPDWREVLAEARALGVSDFVLAGVCRDLWPGMLEMSRNESGVHAAPGLHPMYLARHTNCDLEVLKSLAAEAGIVAIGEIGLDYYVRDIDHEGQQELFEAQLDIAAAYSLPVLLHVRKAHDRVLATLRKKNFPGGGIVHAYNGSLQQAGQYIDLGFRIGVGGAITFPRATKIRHVAATLPLDNLVLETDAPDMPPASHYGERNRPANILLVVEALSEIRGENPCDIACTTTAGARDVLHLHR